MRFKIAISIITATVLALTSVSSFAGQGKGPGSSASQDRAQQVDRDRSYDRDRMQDRARVDYPEQDRDRDRDRIHAPDPANLRDQDIYGKELMNDSELKKYRKELGNANSLQAREKYQMKHEEKMQKRALKQGQDLVPPGQGPLYGGELMSVQERNQYREQLRLIDDDQEREQFQAQHRDRIDKRAHALELEVEEAE